MKILRFTLGLLCAWLFVTLPARAQPVAQETTRIYLPLVSNPARIWEDMPIWTHAQAPASHEVALFRESFTLLSPLEGAQLHIFADTRYEAWLDGAWIGRGPARFSHNLREYDVYELGDLPPGEHLLAVLAQWAPNVRRSESTTPHVLAHIQGAQSGKLVTLARSGPGWKSLLSDAWRQDAALVHTWGLIGPTELLDFSRLPADWNQPAYPADGWAPAVVKDISQVSYQPLQVPPLDPEETTWFSPQPAQAAGQSSLDLDSVTFRRRSIPFLVSAPVTPTLAGAGTLYPGMMMGELAPPYPADPLVNFSLPAPVTFTIETLSAFSATLRLDSNPIAWQAQGTARPDVYAAHLPLQSGDHSISFAALPPDGVTFAASSAGVSYSQFPFQQGVNAGRRLLLANPQEDPGRVRVLAAQPLSLEFQAGQTYAILDLGRTVHGRLQATLNGPAGALVDIGWDERLSASGRPLPHPGSLHPQWNQVDSWVSDGQARQLTTLDTRSGRYLLIAVWASQPVTLGEIRVYEERYPNALRASFTSSSPLLDQIWQIGVQSLYPNLTDSYNDTPWRERGQWWGDAYVAEQVQRTVFGETALLRRGLDYMADAFAYSASPGAAPNANGTHMLDYGMLWVQSLAEYSAFSADPYLPHQLYPRLRSFMAHLASYEDPTSGLLDLPSDHWSQTAYIESFGEASRVGQSTALNAMYYGALLQAATLATQEGDLAAAQIWQSKAERVYASVNQLLYLPAEQRYVTTITQGLPSPPTPQAQAWALAYGLVPAAQQDGVVSALLELLSSDPDQPNLDVYGMFWVLQALGRSGHIPEALQIIENYYGYMLAGGATTWWEKFSAGENYRASLSHSWGGSPTWFLSAYVLGAQPNGPHGWLVKPAFSGVTSASGALALRDGELQVSWERTTCQEGALEIASPEGTPGEAVFPLDAPSLRITLDGETIWENGAALVPGVSQDSEGVHVLLQGGSYQFTFTQVCSPLE